MLFFALTRLVLLQQGTQAENPPYVQYYKLMALNNAFTWTDKLINWIFQKTNWQTVQVIQ